MSAVAQAVTEEIAITLDSQALQEALRAGVKPGRSTLPIIGHALLEAKNGSLAVTTSDMQATVTVSVPCSAGDWKATAKIELLAAALSGLPGEVVLRLKQAPDEIGPGTLLMTCGRRRFSIPCLDPEDYPRPRLGDQRPVQTDPVELRNAMARIAYGMSKNDGRHYLNGLHLTDGYAVAANGHRGGVAPVKWGGGDVIIPRDSVTPLLDALGEDAAVSVSNNALTVQRDGLRFVTLLIDSRYPDWRRGLFPADDDLSIGVTFNPADMQAALRRVAPFSNVGDTASVDLSARAGTLTVAAIDGRTEDVVECSDGDEQAARMQCKYLQEICQVAAPATVRWKMKGGDFSFFSIDGRHDTHSVMGMRK